MLPMFLLLSPAIVILSRLDRFDVNDDLLLMVWNVSSSIDFHFAGEICSLPQHIFPIFQIEKAKSYENKFHHNRGDIHGGNVKKSYSEILVKGENLKYFWVCKNFFQNFIVYRTYNQDLFFWIKRENLIKDFFWSCVKSIKI